MSIIDISKEFNLEQVRKNHPVIDSYTYVNHAATSPISLSVCEAMFDASKLHMTSPQEVVDLSYPIYDEGRDLAAELVSAPKDRIAYIQNTSHGISLIAQGMDWKQGDNLVLPELEFPSNLLPWLVLESKGVEIRKVPAIDGRLTAESLSQYVDNRTKLVAVSHVQFYNGYRVDLAAFAEVCHKQNALLVVDGTQSAGAMVLNMEKTGVDVVVASAHKWMMGPMGVGFAAFSENAFHRISVAVPGWLSVNDPYQFKRELDFVPTGRRFEPGTENGAGIFGLTERLRNFKQIPVTFIEQRIFSLLDEFADKIKAKGYRVTSTMKPSERSGIFTFYHPEIATEVLFAELSAANVKTSIRNGCIRISPHFYNSEQEMDFIAEILPSKAKIAI